MKLSELYVRTVNAPKTIVSRGVSRRASQNKSPNMFNRDQIPTYASDQVQSLKVRYYVPSTYGGDVKQFTMELPIYPYGISDSGSTILLPLKAVRLKKIEMWCNYRPEQGIEGNTINLTFVERRTVRPIEWSDTATYATPAHIKKKFSKFDPLGLWYSTVSSETNPEISFQMPKGAILELTFSFILHDGESCGTSAGSSLAYPKVYTNKLNADISVVGKVYAAVITP